MYLDKNEITIVFNGDDSKSKKVMAYARIHKKKVNTQDISKNEISSTLISHLVSKSKDSIKGFLNKADSFYQKNIRGRDFTPREWGYILKNNPSLLAHPIVFFNDTCISLKTPSKLYTVFSNVD